MEQTCNVCYKNLNLENSVKTICNHFFCSNCFFRWLSTNNTCPMCRLDFCNRIITRTEQENYSTEILELIIKGEEITQQNMGLINENKELKLEKKTLKKTINKYQELEKTELELLAKMNIELGKSQIRLREHRRELRILKIKKINLKKKKLRLSGFNNF